MAFVNTWLPGTIFIAFAGYAASAGAIGFYFVAYSILAVVLMFLLARPVHEWGRSFDLRTQADLLGLRYGCTKVRVIAAVIGTIASFPWVVLGMQSLTLVFEYLSFGTVPAAWAALIGIGVLVVRQWWTVRLGAAGWSSATSSRRRRLLLRHGADPRSAHLAAHQRARLR